MTDEVERLQALAKRQQRDRDMPMNSSEIPNSSPMTDKDWHEIEALYAMGVQGRLSAQWYESLAELLARTRTEDECPEWFDGPCECRTCGSYMD